MTHSVYERLGVGFPNRGGRLPLDTPPVATYFRYPHDEVWRSVSEPNSEKQDEVRPSLLYKPKPITLGNELAFFVVLLVFGAGLIGVYIWLGEPDNLLVTVPLGALAVLTILLLAFLAFDIVVTTVTAISFRAWVIILLLLILLVLISRR